MVMFSLLARGATRRARLSHPQRLPTLDPSSTAASVRLLRFPYQRLPELPAPRFPLELSAPPDNKPGFQCSVKQSRLRYHVVDVWDGSVRLRGITVQISTVKSCNGCRAANQIWKMPLSPSCKVSSCDCKRSQQLGQPTVRS